MSYKWDLSELDRESSVSLTQQLVDHISRLIDGGELEPGEKLPPTRELAAAAGINHLTAARVYRRLAELGYVTAAVGRGTFVRTVPPAPAGAPAPELAGDDWQAAVLPERLVSSSARALQEVFRVARDPDVISLAAGFPAQELVPVRELERVAAEVFAEEGADALAYLNSPGLPVLREELARRGRDAGFAFTAEEIIVTSGAMQGLDLVTRAILRPGDVAVVESPSYAGLLTSLQDTGARVIGLPVDEDGLDVDALERVLARHEVKLVALQSTCHNPTGRDLSPERGERLARLARERSFFVLEDGVYATLRYDGDERRRLRALAPSQVVYVDSLSKTVGGGLRLGWIAARGPVLARLVALKMSGDIATPTPVQHIAARYLASGAHDELLRRVIPEYRARRDALCEALDRHLADEVAYLRPRGGHQVWATLRRPLDEQALYLEALRAGVAFMPGSAATVDASGATSLRLSFSLRRPPELDEAIRRLATAVRAARRIERDLGVLPLS